MATAETLQELFDPQEPLNSTKLLSLSGITREEALEVEEFWFDAPPARRTALLDQMLTLTEDNPEADFTEVLRLAMDDEDPILRISAIDGLWECNERWLLGKAHRLCQGRGGPRGAGCGYPGARQVHAVGRL